MFWKPVTSYKPTYWLTGYRFNKPRINTDLSQCPSQWPLGSCNNSWSDHINYLGFSDRWTDYQFWATDKVRSPSPIWSYQLWQTLSLGCHIHDGTYLTLSPTLTIMLTLLTLTVTVRVSLTLLTLILGTVVNMAP